MRTIRALTGLVMLTASVGVASPARADAVSVCVHSVTWTFDPPLTLAGGSGEFVLAWSSLCRSNESGVLTLTPDTGSRSGTYTGTCLLALASAPAGSGVSAMSATIVGGTLIEHHGFGDSVEFGDVNVVLADSICFESEAQGVAVGFVSTGSGMRP